jgi:hypothetical protein
MNKATVIRTHGELRTELDHKPTLEEAQQIVGGYIEYVKVKEGTLVVNEEGRLLGLPYNDVASKMYGGIIVGNVILLQGWRGVA